MSPGMITHKHIPRRTVLRGVGVSLALPLLDSMVPAMAAARKTAAKPICRLGAVYVPNGMNMAQWTPATEGPGFELTSILSPLAPYRDRVLVLSGLSHRAADALPGEGQGDHSRAQAAFLTGAHAKKTQGPDAEVGISMDQIAAKALGQHTQLASLELGLEANDLVGGCDVGLSCVYSATISWRTATTPLPIETDPRATFERLFGATESTDRRARLERIQMERSVLDVIRGELNHLEKGLGPGDRLKLDEYVEAVRDVERRIQKAEEQSAQELPVVARPAGIPGSFEEHAQLMFELMALAYESDLTRVGTFMMGREKSVRTYPEIGVPESHHPVSHHQNRAESLEKLAKISVYHMQLFARFLERLRSTSDGDGSLLDHSVIIYGSGLSNSNIHLHDDLPILLAGGAAGQIRGGRHLRFAKDTPMANLHLTVLDKMGIPIDRLGDSNGKVELLSDV